MKGPREKVMYVSLISCDLKKPDALATVDIDPNSQTCGQVINLLEMPYVRDELHHFGWNACSSSCCRDLTRRFLVVPGFISSRIYIIDTEDVRHPKIHKIIEPWLIKEKVNLSTPHTVHCLPSGHVMISMLGDGVKMEAPGGFLLLDPDFNIAGRWSNDEAKMKFNHDFWYQPYHNCMVSTELGAPKDFAPGLKFSDIGGGKYGTGLCLWNWQEQTLMKRVDLGEEGTLTIGGRFLHDPLSSHGFVASALSSSLWHMFMDDSNTWQVEKFEQLEGYKSAGWPMPVPSFSGDLVISLDDRFLYVSNWFNGDIRQYDIKNPSKPTLVGQVFLHAGIRGNAGNVHTQRAELKNLKAGPHMLQLSLDGQRLYVTNSFVTTWDDQFYPELGANGSQMIRINCDTVKGGLDVDESFFVDFGNVNGNKYRAHEMRYPGGDCTSDIWLPSHSA